MLGRQEWSLPGSTSGSVGGRAKMAPRGLPGGGHGSTRRATEKLPGVGVPYERASWQIPRRDADFIVSPDPPLIRRRAQPLRPPRPLRFNVLPIPGGIASTSKAPVWPFDDRRGGSGRHVLTAQYCGGPRTAFMNSIFPAVVRGLPCPFRGHSQPIAAASINRRPNDPASTPDTAPTR